MLTHARNAMSSLPRLIRSVSARIVPASGVIMPVPDTFDPMESTPEDRLSIHVRDQTTDDIACREIQRRGQFLARQDRWDELSAELARADSSRACTPGGMPVSELLAWGARADVIRAVEHALQEGRRHDDAPVLEGIRELEALLTEMPDDPIIAMIVALAHVDIGLTWRGTGWDSILPKLNRDLSAQHFDRAGAILQPYCCIELDSPAIAAARCALHAARRDPNLRIADDFEDLIDLDPGNHRHMRALGSHMLPRRLGSYDDLELEARRTAARTQDIWGAGAYTWVSFDAIATDDRACALVDVDFFLDGLRDIVAIHPEQEMINLLAAYCAVAIRNGMGTNTEADLNRTRISQAAGWLIRDHLTELHPMIWAHAAEGFDTQARITSLARFAARGRADALRIIADQFRDDFDRGLRVVFTPEGPQLHQA
jgi:hypothetical protein